MSGRTGLRVAMSSGTLDEPLLTASQVSELLGGIPTKTILQYARDGRLPCLRIGKHVRFIRSEIDRTLAVQRSARRSSTRYSVRRTLPARAARRLDVPMAELRNLPPVRGDEGDLFLAYND